KASRFSRPTKSSFARTLLAPVTGHWLWTLPGPKRVSLTVWRKSGTAALLTSSMFGARNASLRSVRPRALESLRPFSHPKPSRSRKRFVRPGPSSTSNIKPNVMAEEALEYERRIYLLQNQSRDQWQSDAAGQSAARNQFHLFLPALVSPHGFRQIRVSQGTRHADDFVPEPSGADWRSKPARTGRSHPGPLC